MYKPVIFMFSGQGSQYYHMGKELYEKNQTFHDNLNMLNNYLEDLIGKSIISIIFDPQKNKADIFNRISYTNPALFCIQYSNMSLPGCGVYIAGL